MHIADFVSRLPAFCNQDQAAHLALAAELQQIHLPAGSVLFRQGDPADALYIVRAGRLCVIFTQPDGSENCVADIFPGAFVGEMALLTGQRRVATVVAAQDADLVHLSKPAFDRLSDAYPHLFDRLVDWETPRIQRTQVLPILTRLFGKMDDATLRDLYDRLEWRRLANGEVLFRQGDPGDSLYIVVQGRLRFSTQEASGEVRILGEAGSGEVLGEFALLAESGTPESLRSATVSATRRSDVAAIPRHVFDRLLRQYPRLLLNIARGAFQRGRLMSQSTLAQAGPLVIALVPLQPSLPLGEFGRLLAGAMSAAGAEHSPGAALFLDAASFEQQYGKPGIADTPLDHPTSMVVEAWLGEREREHRYVIYDCSPTLDTEGSLTHWARRCVGDADVVLLVADARAAPAPGPVDAALRAGEAHARVELVLLHPAGCELPSGTAAWLAVRRADPCPLQAHHHVRAGLAGDMRRLARRLAGCPVGLALSGGGARGFAHIGVVRALEEAGIEIDWIAGASMGALLAAGYALDWPAARIGALAAGFADPKKLLDYTFPWVSITATRRVTAIIQQLCGTAGIEDTWRPFFCISTNLTRAQEQVHTSGPLWKALRASMAFPAVFAPVLDDDGSVLIDGGAANNLPIDRMRERCPAGTVLGVELITSTPLAKDYDFGPSLSGWQALLSRWLPAKWKVKAPTVLDVVAGVVDSNSRDRLNLVRNSADLLIQVPVEAYGLLEFGKYEDLIGLGYTAAKAQLETFLAR